LIGDIKEDISAIIQLAPVLKFNGGGHLNHSLFWQMLTPNGTSEPTGPLGDAIKRDFGSFANMIQQLSDISLSVQGVCYLSYFYSIDEK
jgi:Fe-Mn family superoxide dismutase